MSDVHSPRLPAPAAWPPPTPTPAAARGASTSPSTDGPAPSLEPGLDRSDLSPTPLPSRPLWMIAGTVLLIGTVFWGCFSIVSVLAREEWERSYVQPAAGITTLRVNADDGRVVVRGADTDEITVDAEVSRGLFGVDESAERVGDSYVLSADCPPLGNEWCSVDYTITVPVGMDVEIDGQNGTVDIAGVDGSVDVDNDNGRVELSDVSGPIVVRSDNGRVVGTGLTSATADVGSDNGRVELTFATAPDAVVASSDNGSIDVAVPDVDGDYAVVAQASNGSVNVDVTSDPTSSRTITASSDNGGITVRYAS